VELETWDLTDLNAAFDWNTPKALLFKKNGRTAHFFRAADWLETSPFDLR